MTGTWAKNQLFRALTGAAAAGALVVATSTVPAGATCTTPPGDINGSGSSNVADALCCVLVGLWQTTVNAGVGNPASPPACLSGPIFNSDQNCDGVVNVSDAQVVIQIAVGNALPPALDSDGSGCIDVCESVNLPGPPVVVPAFVHGVSTGGGLRLQALGTGASAVGTSSGTVGGQNLNLEPHPVAK